MTQPSHSSHALRVADLRHARATRFDITPSASELDALRDNLGLTDLRKVRFTGEISPLGKRDWHLTARLGATVVQPCVATLEPVTTRVETEVERQYLAEFEDPDEPEAEMPDDDNVEALGTHIDPLAVLSESLSLALPLYPRANGTDPVSLQITEPGKEALRDEDTKPFAALAKLKDSMKPDDS